MNLTQQEATIKAIQRNIDIALTEQAHDGLDSTMNRSWIDDCRKKIEDLKAEDRRSRRKAVRNNSDMAERARAHISEGY